MFNVNLAILDNLSAFMLIFFRISTFFMIAPVFKSTSIPARVKIIFSLLISFIILTTLSVKETIPLVSLPGLLLIFQQILLGLLTGFIFQIVFEIFNGAGQLTALQTGLGFASLVDPQSNTQSTVIGEIYVISSILVFLSLNGHLELIKLFTNSFDAFPITGQQISAEKIRLIIDFSGTIFKDSILVSLPAIIALLIVNLIFAITSSIAPQLNIINLGFPITLLFGLIIIYLGLSNVILYEPKIFEKGFSEMLHLFKGK